MAYRVEISSNNRAGCQATHCKNAEGGPIKIQKGEIRQGVSVTINEHTSMKYRHWGCVTPAVLHNWHETSGGDMDLVDGYDELPEDAQEKVKRALEQGHVDDDDWNGDVECNRWNGKKSQGMFLKGNAKKQAEATEDGDDNKKRSVEADSDDEKPAAKKARASASASAEAEETTPAKRGRGRPKKATTDATPKAAAADPDAPKRGRGRPRKSVATDGAADESAPAPASDTPKRGRGRPKKPRPTDEDGNEIVEAPKPKSGRGRGRPKKSA